MSEQYGKKAFSTEFPKQAEDWCFSKNGDLKPWEIKLYDERGRYVWWQCKKGHTYIKSLVAKSGIRSFYGTVCPVCNASPFELNVYQLLDDHKIEYECEFMPLDMEINGRFDIHILDKNFDDRILIEIDGTQHFEDKQIGYKLSKVADVSHNDNIKNKYAFDNGYLLLRIPTTMFKTFGDVFGLITFFMDKKIVPYEIINFYSRFQFNNYAEYAERQNERMRESQRFLDARGLS